MSSGNIHNRVDMQPIGGQLFEIVDHAWQAVLADSGDTYDSRYANLTDGVGLALLTSSEREPKPLGGDNPLELFVDRDGTVRDFANLAERGTNDLGQLKYRSNHRDRFAQLDPTLLGVRYADQIQGAVLDHGRFAINAAAKRLFLLNNPDATTSFNTEGSNTGFYGELGAAGAIRANENGIISISGGNQIHDDALALHWLWLAESALDRGAETLTGSQVDDLKEVVERSFRYIVLRQADAAENIDKKIGELEGPDIAAMLRFSRVFLLRSAG